MKLAIMQPYFFPYIGYFQLINAVDKFIFYDDVAYIKQGWINRNNILIQKKSALINMPLKETSSFKAIKDIELFKYEFFARKVIKTLELNYKKAPYYNETMNLLSELFSYANWETISDFNAFTVTKVSNYLDIRTEFQKASECVYNTTESRGQERIIDICIEEKASTYINPIGGQELYSKEVFNEAGIELLFLKANNITYKQFDQSKLPNLSIIDVLMFNQKSEVKLFLEDYTLN